MKHFDFETLLNNYHRRFKNNLILTIISSILFVAVFVIGIFVANYENKMAIMIIFSVILGLFSFLIITFLVLGVFENHKNIKQLNYILGGYLTVVTGKITQIKGIFTSISGRKGIEIIVTDNKEEISVYLDLTFDEIPFKIGDEVSLKVSESFIIDYEVKNA